MENNNLNNSRILLRFYHPDIKSLSDRTLRIIIKEVSRICRNIQLKEIEDLINNSEIEYRLRQSIKDKVFHNIPNKPAFYTEKLSKGSIEIIVILSAVGGWFLTTVIGDTIKKSFQDSELGKSTHGSFLKFFNVIQKHIIERPKYIKSKIVPLLEDRAIGERFIIDEIETTSFEKDLNINIKLKTISELDADDLNEIIDEKKVLTLITKKIKSTKKYKSKS